MCGDMNLVLSRGSIIFRTQTDESPIFKKLGDFDFVTQIGRSDREICGHLGRKRDGIGSGIDMGATPLQFRC